MRFRGLFFILVLPWLAPAPAHAGDGAAGLAFVSRWCGVCHSVERAPANRGLALPFMALAERGGGDGAWFRAWLSAPHPTLTIPNLSATDIDNVVAYLKVLVPTKRH